MTFSNLCALYENACLDYEVSVLTEGADSEEAKTAKAKKTGLGKKVFASIGAAFRKLGQMIMRVLTFIKRRFVRDKVKLANDIRITPATTYKKILKDVISYSLFVDDEGNMKDAKFLNGEKAEFSPFDFTDMSYGPGTVIDKTSYQEVLEKAKRLTSKYERLETAASNLSAKYSDDNQKGIPAIAKGTAYRSILKALSSITTRIDSDMKEISDNAVPEDVAPVNDKKEKADANNESAIFGGLTRNELRAKLLIEAADALAADDNSTNTDALGDNGDGKVTPTCLDCDKEEADVDDDYLPPVSGADDENSDPEMDEIEDLLDDEKDAIDILTDREGTETVDAQEPTLESILGLDF